MGIISTATDRGSSCFTVGCFVLAFLTNIVLGGWSVNYLLLSIFDKTIPFLFSAIIGLFVGEFSVPIAVIVLILRNFGILW